MRKDIQAKLKEMPELLSIGQVAEIFSIHPDTLRNWEKDGTLVPLRAGKRGDRKYRPQDIQAIVDKMGSKLTLPQLESFLWKSADILRGKIDSSDYKKYIFGLLFYKRMSDVWDEEYNAVMEEYGNEDVARADYNHRFQIPKDCRWEKITEQAEAIGQKLNDIFDKLANANSPKLDKIFEDLDFANKDRFPNETLQRLINHFSQYNFGNTYISSDLLGDAYEYLIKQFAADAGKKGGEFYTPREVEKVIVSILKPHQKDHIYDPTVGSGGFLLEAYDYLKKKSGEKVAKTLYLYGQEQNLATFAIAKINMFLHGLDSADIRRGDTLANPQFLNPQGGLQTFDIVVANPPYSIKDWEYEAFKNKFGRLEGYEAPPDKNADYAFLLHIIKSMNTNGRAGVVVPHGVLTRGGAEARIREQILKNDLLETIIALPPKLFYGTGISAVVLILNKNKSPDKKEQVLIIDAEGEFAEGKNQNFLQKQHIDKIVKAQDENVDIKKFARVVDLAEIKKNQYNLNVGHYIDSSTKVESINIDETWIKIEALQEKIVTLQKNTKGLLKSLKVNNHISPQKIPTGWSVVRLEQLVERIIGGGTPSRKEPQYWGGAIPWVTVKDLGKTKYIKSSQETITDIGLKESASNLIPENSIITSTRMGVGRFFINTLPISINQDLKALILKKDIDLDFLYWALRAKGSFLEGRATGTTVKGIKLDELRNLKIHIPNTLSEQKKIASILSAVYEGTQNAEEMSILGKKLTQGLMQSLLQGNSIT